MVMFEQTHSRAPLPSALSSATNPLSQKLSHILSNSFIDPEISTALNVLESEGFVNSTASRQGLSSDIALQELRANKTVLDDYKRLVDEIRLIKLGLDSIQGACDHMRVQAQSVESSSSQLLEQSAFLQEQKKKIETKQQVLTRFRAKFAVEDNELSVLSSSDAVDEEFFRCLDKVTSIHEKCSILLVAETQTAGLEIMDAMTKHLESGFAKLHRWILKELKSTSIGVTEANALLRRGLKVLSTRRDLYEQTLDNVSESRRRAVAADFEHARTRGKLESNNNDAMRFVGDVLAWLHQSIASEKEVIELILGSGVTVSPLDALTETAVSDAEYRALQDDLVDRSFAMILKPLQQRIDQVVVAQYDRITSFRVAILIRFYRDLVERVLDENAAVIRSLQNMEKSATSRFMQTTRNLITTISARPPEVGLNTLEIPVFLIDTIDDLTTVLEILNDSFLEVSEKKLEFTDIWDQLLRQCIEICVRMASELPQPSSSVFLLNCLSKVRAKLEAFPFTTKQLEMCRSAADRCSQALVVEQHDYLLRNAGIITQIEGLEENHNHISVSRLPEFDLDALKGLSKQLAGFVPKALADLSNRLERLHDSNVVEHINREAVERFVKDYAQVEEAVLANVEFGRSVLTMTNGEIMRALCK